MKRAAPATPTKGAKPKPKRARQPLSCGALLPPTEPLFTIGGDDATTALVAAELIRRPSARNRSPYVADVRLPCGRVAIAHVPSLDLGGKCLAGAKVLVKPAVDAKGRLVGPDAVSPKPAARAEIDSRSQPRRDLDVPSQRRRGRQPWIFRRSDAAAET